MNRVVIVDTGVSNVHSILRAVEECGATGVLTEHPDELRSASRIILPGVGSFPSAIENLERTGMSAELQEQVIGASIPFLGICLGMQLLAAKGYERRPTDGLGWIPGEVRLLDPREGERIPHVGWNSVDFVRSSTLFHGIEPGRDFYFVHSYALFPSDQSHVLATVDYAGGFTAAVEHEHILGVQFHPEKSQRAGLDVLRNFISI